MRARTVHHVQTLEARVRYRLDAPGDNQLRQLRGLERAYSGRRGPDVLLFGDSASYWTMPSEPDSRAMLQMLAAELPSGTSLHTVVGPAYSARIIAAFAAGFRRWRSRPRVVVIPATLLTMMDVHLEDPRYNYVAASGWIADALAGRDDHAARKRHSDRAAQDAFDRLPAPSLIGARRTFGELRLIGSATPTTRWQQVVRLRHMMDLYNAERLDPDSKGIAQLAALARLLSELEIPSVAYIPPINYEVIVKALGAGSRQHVACNVEVVESAIREAGGSRAQVVNAAFDHAAQGFLDPLHLKAAGRVQLARRIAAACAGCLDVRPVRA
ncbi:MAG TPA: hypothetical protein VHC41_06050 [Mycobacteriales bacterium]|nr:hypothetical protein [Mycobacteriales bacterium]